MYLNTPKRISNTVYGDPANFIIGGVQHRVIDTPARGMCGGTPECKLNFPSSHSKRVGFLCMTGNPYALFGRLAGVIE